MTLKSQLKKIEQERLDSLTDYMRVLEGIENTEIYVIANNQQYYRLKVKFFGHNGQWYLPDYYKTKNGEYTLLKKHKERDRIFVTSKVIDNNWVISATIEVAKGRADVLNDHVTAIAYNKILDITDGK